MQFQATRAINYLLTCLRSLSCTIILTSAGLWLTSLPRQWKIRQKSSACKLSCKCSRIRQSPITRTRWRVSSLIGLKATDRPSPRRKNRRALNLPRWTSAQRACWEYMWPILMWTEYVHAYLGQVSSMLMIVFKTVAQHYRRLERVNCWYWHSID